MQDAERGAVDPARAQREGGDPRRFASQLRVKLGTIRPATTEISTMTAASPSRQPSPDGTATPQPPDASADWRSREWPPARPSAGCASSARRRSPGPRPRPGPTGNDRSAAIGDPGRNKRRDQAGDAAEQPQPGQQRRADRRGPEGGRSSSGSRSAGSRRSPPSTKPNSISWICQASGSNRLGRAAPVINITIQSASATADQSPAARKNGRNP